MYDVIREKEKKVKEYEHDENGSQVKKQVKNLKKGKKEPVGEFERHQRHNTQNTSSRNTNVGNTQQRETRQFLRVVLFLVVCPFVFFFVRLFVRLGDDDAKRVLLVFSLPTEKNTSADLLRAENHHRFVFLFFNFFGEKQRKRQNEFLDELLDEFFFFFSVS